MKQFQAGSSDVDWCETNYSITVFVAEFFNTVSNILFVLIPPLLMRLFRQYSIQLDQHVNIVWALLVVVGIGSAYFHATLSLVGQLVDELAILWVIMAALALWYPKRLFPAVFHQNRRTFIRVIFVFGVISSGLACIKPIFNAFAMMAIGPPVAILLFSELRRTTYRRAMMLGARCLTSFLLAVVCWLNDRLFCDVWISFPYLHGLWHILIFLAAYTACVLFAFFAAANEVPEQMPIIKYWPRDSWDFFGIPYVSFKGDDKMMCP